MIARTSKTCHVLDHAVANLDFGLMLQKNGYPRLALYREILEYLPQRPRRVIDLACRGGHFLRFLVDHFKQQGEWILLTGVDCDQSAVDLASRLVPEGVFRQAPADHTRFPAGTFDLVLSIETLEHLKRPKSALREAWRLVAPGGYLLITIPDGAKDRWLGITNRWSADAFLKFLRPLSVQSWHRLEHGRSLLFVVQRPAGHVEGSSFGATLVGYVIRGLNRLLGRWGSRLDLSGPRPVFLSDFGRFHYQADYIKPVPRSSAIVLDVGSGHYPFPYATLLGDVTAGPTIHRAESLRHDNRPLVIFDAHHLPFADRSIDFTYCSHVLEHVEDPAKACAELMRVSREGYIETPTLGKDALFGWALGMHKWHVVAVGNTLVFFEYDEQQMEGMRSTAWRELVHGPNSHPLQSSFHENEDVFNVMFRWRNHFECVVFHLPGTSS